MVNIGDLVVSLQIDKSDDLYNLKQQLDAIVGRGGNKDPFDGLEMDPMLSRNVREIKRKVQYLFPTFGYGKQEPEKFRKESGIALKNINERPETIAEKLIPQQEKHLKTFMESMNIDTDDLIEGRKKLKEELVKWLEGDIKTRLENILNGNESLDKKSERFLTILERIMDSSQRFGHLAKTLYTRLQNTFQEAQIEWENIFSSKMDELPQLSIFRQGKKFFEEAKNIEFEETFDDLENKFSDKELEKLFEDLPPYKAIREIMRELGSDNKEILNAIKAGPRTIEGKFALKKMVEAIKKGIINKERKEKFWLPSGFYDAIYDLMDDVNKTDKEMKVGERRLDIDIFGRLEKLKDVLGENSELYNDIKDLIDMSIEIKGNASYSNKLINQVDDEIEAVGKENFLLIARQVKPDLKSWLEQKEIRYKEVPNIRKINEMLERAKEHMTPEQIAEQERRMERLIRAGNIVEKITGMKGLEKELGLKDPMIKIEEILREISKDNKDDKKLLRKIISLLVEKGVIEKKEGTKLQKKVKSGF